MNNNEKKNGKSELKQQDTAADYNNCNHELKHEDWRSYARNERMKGMQKLQASQLTSEGGNNLLD